jgi:hypothetical protein
MKKPRADSTLLNLPEEQMSTLCDWLLSGLPQAKVLTLLQKEFKVKTSNASLSRFYEKVCVPALLERRRRAVAQAEAIAEDAKKAPGQFDEAIIDSIKQTVVSVASSPTPDAKMVKDLFSLALKANAQALNKEQISLEREKFEFDAAKAALAHLPALREIANARGMDDAAKLQAVRKKLFGEVPS